MLIPIKAMAPPIPVIFSVLLLCCLTVLISNSSAENMDDKQVLAEISNTFGIKQVERRQANASATATTLLVPTESLPSPADGGQSPVPLQSTKKPKKTDKDTDETNEKPKMTTASPARNFTDVVSIGNVSDTAKTRMTMIERNEQVGNVTLVFEPKTVYVHEGETKNLTITYANLRTPLIIKLKNVDPSVYQILTDDTFRLMPSLGGENATKTITIEGKKLGITGLAIIVIEPLKAPPSEPTSIHIIKTSRIPRNIDKIFDYSLMPVVIVAITGIGCKMEWTLIKSQLRRPFPISVGALCQFLLMPFFAFAIAKMIKLDMLVAFGLLTVGSCPGGGLSNVITLLVQADLIQSVVMTFCSIILAVGMLPFNLWLYSKAFVPANRGDGDQRMNLPLQKLSIQLIMLAIPLIIGVLLRHKLPKVAHYLSKPVNALGAFLLVITLGLALYSNAYVIYSPWQVLLSAFLLPVFGFTASFIIARFLARLPTRSALTVCIETGVQNNVIAVAMLKLSFPQPEADLMARTPIFVALTAITVGIIMIVLAIPINKRVNRLMESKPDVERHSVDGKADTEPESPEPYSRYEYKPIPYEKAKAMNGGTTDGESKTIDGSEYKTLNEEPEEVNTHKERMAEEDDPLYVKMRKTSQETDV